MFNYLVLIFFLNLFLFIFYKPISKIYNLFDYPDNKRKIHQKPTPLLGGLFLILNLLIILIYKIFFLNLINLDFFDDLNIYISFLFIAFCFYLIGFFDDKYKLSYSLKFFLTITLIVLTLYIDDTIVLKNLIFSFSKFEINLGFFSYPLTILCFLLFINALNMLDGINCQVASYIALIFLLFTFKTTLLLFSISIVIFLIFFLILNYQNKSFLGDSGSLTFGYTLSYIFIKLYNTDKVFLVDEVFLIMSIPGYELLRLAVQRILNQKHPFLPDNNHIHHLIIRRFNFLSSFLIVQFLLIFPYSIYIFSGNFFFSLLISLFLYIFLIFFFKKNKFLNI
jgi:UDP-GlcNAc:undecaprenyl-phosphate GlcNAc-1-phosphate transferase